jgi:hypothetical protein
VHRPLEIADIRAHDDVRRRWMHFSGPPISGSASRR